jgi:hypothetical protein
MESRRENLTRRMYARLEEGENEKADSYLEGECLPLVKLY